MPEQAITIDLAVGDINGTIQAGNLIQKKSFANLHAQIHTDLKTAKNLRPSSKDDLQRRPSLYDEYPPGTGLVYFVDGTRGAGKSTFLRTVFAELPVYCAKDEESRVKLAQLAYIDPSRIEQNELVLLSVLKQLQRLVDDHQRSRSRYGEEASADGVRTAFKKLAEGLIVLDKNHNQIKYVDPELYTDWGLERAGYSADLRNRLHLLLEKTCDLLGVDALLLAFDDADTKAEHAHAVLECIRNYLDTPRLVTLVTGDMELYSLLVRDRFHRELTPANVRSGADRERQRIRMVDHLEEQYLLKLFPIRRRLQLRPLWNLLESGPGGDVYRLIRSDWTDGRDPRIVLSEIIRRALRIKSPGDIALYREFLLKQPLRSVLQVLARCADGVSESDALGATSNAWSQPLADAARDSLRGVTLGSLYKLNVDVDAIAAHELAPLIEAVFDLGVLDGDFDTATYLRPQSSETDIRNCFIALSADVAMLCAKRPANQIQYMFSGPGSVALYGKVLRRASGPTTDDATLLRQFKKYMGVGRKEDALNWARHATIIIGMPYVQNAKRPVVHLGIIGLNKRKPGRADAEAGFELFGSVINAVSKGRSSTLPAFALSLVDLSGTGARTYASIFNTLGLISRLLTIELQTDDEGRAKAEAAASAVLGKVYPAVSVSRPEWEGEEANVEDAEASGDPEYNKFPSLTSAVVSWLYATQPYREKIMPSALLIGKIWTRLYFSLEKVCDAQRREVASGKVGVADLMELFALCVINAFYVEEIDHHLTPHPIQNDLLDIQDRRNPQTSSKPFLERLRKVSTHRESLPLTYLIASCPLLVGLLNPDSTTMQAVHELLSSGDIAPVGTAQQASLTQPQMTVNLRAGQVRRSVRMATDEVFSAASEAESQTPALSQDTPEQSSIYPADNVMCDSASWVQINKIYIAGMDWKDQAEEAADDKPKEATDTKQRGSRRTSKNAQKEQPGDAE